MPRLASSGDGETGRVRLRQLVCFVRVCELGSISRAAVTLNIAQPALGLQIRGLEHELGAELVVRSSRGVVPTEAGRLVLEYSRGVIEQDQALRRRIGELQDGRPRILRVGMTASMVHLIAGPTIEAARLALPGLRLEIVEGVSELVAQWVDEERIDIGLAFDIDGVTFAARPLLRERLFYLSAPGETAATVTLAKVLSSPLVLPNEHNSIRNAVEAAARTIDMPVIGNYEISSLHANRVIARLGIAGAIVPYGAVAADHERGELSVRMIVEPMLERTLFAVRRHDRAMTEAEEVLTALLVGQLEAAVATMVVRDAYIPASV